MRRLSPDDDGHHVADEEEPADDQVEVHVLPHDRHQRVRASDMR